MWRWNLRTRSFMDADPHPREVSDDVLEALMDQHTVLCMQWDNMYPENPVSAEHDDD
ncbi:MAG: hypothetical protein OXE50_04565 [Chloroflexi bacterium]|nr:hypothetical protein [Chloroflexota bacterium]